MSNLSFRHKKAPFLVAFVFYIFYKIGTIQDLNNKFLKPVLNQ